MKRTLIFLLSLAAVAVAKPPTLDPSASAKPETNPIVEKFSDDVTFYMGFENEFDANLGAGSMQPLSKEGPPTFADGLFGAGLSSGRLTFNARGNLETQSAGSCLFWVRPVGWEPGEAMGYMFPLVIHGDSFTFLVGRMPTNTPPHKSNDLYVHVDYADKTTAAAHQKTGPDDDWVGDEWHLLAITWDQSQIGISVDGRAMVFKALPTPLTDSVRFMVGPVTNKMIVDEMIVLGRALTGEEIEWCYDQLPKAKK